MHRLHFIFLFSFIRHTSHLQPPPPKPCNPISRFFAMMHTSTTLTLPPPPPVYFNPRPPWTAHSNAASRRASSRVTYATAGWTSARSRAWLVRNRGEGGKLAWGISLVFEASVTLFILFFWPKTFIHSCFSPFSVPFQSLSPFSSGQPRVCLVRFVHRPIVFVRHTHSPITFVNVVHRPITFS